MLCNAGSAVLIDVNDKSDPCLSSLSRCLSRDEKGFLVDQKGCLAFFVF